MKYISWSCTLYGLLDAIPAQHSLRTPSFQHDLPQSLDGFLYVSFVQQAERGADVCCLSSIWQEDGTRQGEDALLQSLRADETFGIFLFRAFSARRLQQQLEPVRGYLCDALSDSNDD